MKKKTKRVKLEPVSRLRNRCDALWREVIFTLYGVKCLVCKQNAASQAHHIFHKRANSSVRYHRVNGLPVCTGCHLRERYNPTPVVMRALDAYRAEFWGLWYEVREGPTAHTWTRSELMSIEASFKEVLGLS